MPKSQAGKYAGGSSPKNLPESKGKEYEGGKWGEKGHAKEKAKTDKARTDRKKKKAKLRKALEEYLNRQNNRGGGCLVVDSEGRILLGKRTDTGQWATPGGKIEDDESFEEGALRELREEAGIVGKDPKEVYHNNYNGWESKTFKITSYKGKLKSNGEMVDLKFFEPHELPWDYLTHYTCDAICTHIQDSLKKSSSLKMMLANEQLQKNIIRSGGSTPANTIYELTHGDALRIVGNSTFRFLREAVRDMGDEELKEIHLDHYMISLRKHVNDVYSGRVLDGHKQIHQFTNKSLPALAAELMSIFEWYLPDDEPELELLDEDDLNDSAIEGGLSALVDKYKQHNITNIYTEMENIREEIRNGTAVDLQQVEQKMMKLFDKLESTVLDMAEKHNRLNSDSGSAIDELENKLMSLQTRIDEMSRQPVTMEAYSPSPANKDKVHEENYPYLTKPTVKIDPSGHITISFDSDWSHMERENFLKDMKAKTLKKK